jgi:hypothetical protein
LPKKKYSSTGKIVHVKRGDTLRKIAKRITWRAVGKACGSSIRRRSRIRT